MTGHGFDVVTLGETMVSLRTSAPIRFPARLEATPAGAESNVAIGLARLGHRVRWISRLGADPWGDAIVAALRGEGVDVHVARDADRPTGLMTLAQRTADRAVVEYRRAGSAASALSEEDLAGLGSQRILHLTGITPALSASAARACLEAARRVREAGGRVSLDVNHRRLLWSAEEARRALRELGRLADVVIGGEEELELLGDSPESLLETASVVVMKRGADGAEAWSRDDHVTAPGHRVTVVDPVGAGDGFCAGFLSGLLDGLPLRGCLGRGNTVGAFAVGHVGDWQGYPTRDELALLQAADTTTR